MNYSILHYEFFQMQKHPFSGKFLLIGFGSIGQGVLPLLLKHFDITPDRITIVTADERGKNVAEEYGIGFIIEAVTRENYQQRVLSHIGRGDFLVNVSVDVSSVALINLCQENGIFYIDTVVEPWLGEYTDPNLSTAERSNYAMREKAH